MLNYKIREIKSSELYLLKTFLYEAIYRDDNEPVFTKEIINKPELKIYIENFGNKNDSCLVAAINEKVVGAVWTRILSGSIKGFGYVDNKTPEFAVSVLKGYRRKGIGTALMKEMLKLLKSKRFAKASLSVQKKNYAVSMYKNIGFEIVKEKKEDYLMIFKF